MKKQVIAALLSLASLTFLGLAPGETAPEFAVKNQDGKVVRLSELRGSPVLLFFYPKDGTPGCTREACSFRDKMSRFKELGVTVLGVSRQDAKSHQAFRKEHRLPYDLLTDADGKLAESYGVDRMPLVGYHKRQSVLIGADGKVVRVYKDVDPGTHTGEVLRDLKAASGG